MTEIATSYDDDDDDDDDVYLPPNEIDGVIACI
jgi:hypothetical protein